MIECIPLKSIYKSTNFPSFSFPFFNVFLLYFLRHNRFKVYLTVNQRTNIINLNPHCCMNQQLFQSTLIPITTWPHNQPTNITTIETIPEIVHQTNVLEKVATTETYIQ